MPTLTRSKVTGFDFFLMDGIEVIEAYSRDEVREKYCTTVLHTLEDRGRSYKLSTCDAICSQKCRKVESLMKNKGY